MTVEKLLHIVLLEYFLALQSQRHFPALSSLSIPRSLLIKLKKKILANDYFITFKIIKSAFFTFIIKFSSFFLEVYENNKYFQKF